MNSIPLEDNFNDVLGKAQRGLKLTDEELAKRAGLTIEELTKLKSGDFEESNVRKLTPILKLRADAVVALGKKTWQPRAHPEVPGLACFNTPYHDMTVNSYLVWDPKTNNAVAFDTGADCSSMTRFAAERGLKLQVILLTHTHADHIADLARLKTTTMAEAFVCKLEQIEGATGFEAGRRFTVGRLTIETRQTKGHSPGGITYVVNGLPNKVAIVGDALFAASMGGGNISYSDALETNRISLFTLRDDTIVCPGHGPLTTIGEEKAHSPFFPDM